MFGRRLFFKKAAVVGAGAAMAGSMSMGGPAAVPRAGLMGGVAGAAQSVNIPPSLETIRDLCGEDPVYSAMDTAFNLVKAKAEWRYNYSNEQAVRPGLTSLRLPLHTKLRMQREEDRRLILEMNAQRTAMHKLRQLILGHKPNPAFWDNEVSTYKPLWQTFHW